MPNQQILQYEQRYNQDANVTVEQVKFRTHIFNRHKSLQNLANGCGEPVVQITCFVNQIPYKNTLQNAAT